MVSLRSSTPGYGSLVARAGWRAIRSSVRGAPPPSSVPVLEERCESPAH
ncbi:hypothetical protein N136_03166 [Leifsonia aquatica ATCC 14665]|uniref:Uncharacterized protein n=1 Tax=Leifsonia aquatica ATCC 14665 TaxID=1358026 RepID=U2T731_LEIAQ|nr:hypothetical protein N136_03166 [Leifsonia aquatica ATCC 14665]